MEELGLTKNKIESAINFIRDITPSVYQIVKAAVKVIAARNSTGSTGRGYGSASTNVCVGQIVILNPHDKNISTEDLVDSIIHETTHVMFDCAEPYEPCLPNKRAGIRVESPWTGNYLDPNTYIQACYTWFGLHNYWSYVGERRPKLKKSVQRFLDRSRDGLENGKFISNAENMGQLYTKDVLDSLKYIKANLQP